MSDFSFTLDPDKAALLVIDVQERINGVMADQSHIPRLEVLLDAARELGIPVLTTEQYSKGLGPTLGDLAGRLPMPVIEKDTFSCMRESEFLSALEEVGRDQVIVTGIESHVCVMQTALDLLESDFQVHVPHDAVNSRRPADKEWALHRLAAAGAVVTSTESALFELLGRCGTESFKAVSRLVKNIPV